VYDPDGIEVHTAASDAAILADASPEDEGPWQSIDREPL